MRPAPAPRGFGRAAIDGPGDAGPRLASVAGAAAEASGVNKLLALLRAMSIDNDALADYRASIVKNLSFLGGVVLGVLSLVHMLESRWLLMGLNQVVAGLLLASAWRLARDHQPLLPFSLLMVTLITAVSASVHLQGVPGVLWSYPMLFLCYFTLPRRQALLLSVVLLVAVSVVSQGALGFALTLRVTVSLLFVLLMINVVLGVLADLQRALVTQAITDPLTGSYNRRHLQSHLDRLAPPSGAAAVAVAGPALLAIDIDHFKRINDEHGHDMGDEVLRRLVQLLGSRQRLGDVLFRTGGEEFMLLLPRTGAAAAAQVAETLRELVAQSQLLAGRAVTVSIGVSTLAGAQSVPAWLKAADTALYRAKAQGRNRVVLAA